MRRVGITALVLVLLFGGCQSSRPILNKQTLEISALHGTDISQLDYSVNNDVIELTWARVPNTGSFIRIHLQTGSQKYQPTWDNSDGFIEAVIPGDGFIDVGIVPLAGSGGKPAKLVIEPSDPGKTSSDPPKGGHNKVEHIVAYQLDAGTPSPSSVRLEWTELNTGDYDFNREVNIADITQIAIHMGERYQKESATKREQTLYWIDGDRNGEITVADITPIAVNYMSTVAGYNIYNGLGTPIKTNRVKAQARDKSNPKLPPLYSVLVSGRATDPWQIAPVDDKNVIGALSQKSPTVVEEFNAVGSLVITGLDLYQFPNGTPGLQDSGHSLMRIIDPGDDIDSIEIGDIIEGDNGTFVLHNIPLDQEIALEITFAPVLNLLTGLAFSEDPILNASLSLASPVTVKSLFSIPSGSSNFNMQPRINLAPNENQGYDIHLVVDASWTNGGSNVSIEYNTRLDYFNFRVAAKLVTTPDYQTRPRLRDTNRDMISDAKDQQIADNGDYPVENTIAIQYTGRVTSFDEFSGTLVMVDPEIIDITKPGGKYPAPLGIYEYNFTEYTSFIDQLNPQDFVPVGVENHEVTISCSQLSDNLGGSLPTIRWAKRITRIGF